MPGTSSWPAVRFCRSARNLRDKTWHWDFSISVAHRSKSNGCEGTSIFFIARIGSFNFPRGKIAGYLRGVLCRPFFRRYFPNYNVYVWIDSDAWVNHWSAMELLTQGAVKRGMAVALELDRGYQVHFGKWQSLCQYMYRHYYSAFGEEIAKKLHSHPVINAGVFAMHCSAPHWEHWAQYIEQGLQNHAGLMTDQVAHKRARLRRRTLGAHGVLARLVQLDVPSRLAGVGPRTAVLGGTLPAASSYRYHPSHSCQYLA